MVFYRGFEIRRSPPMTTSELRWDRKDVPRHARRDIGGTHLATLITLLSTRPSGPMVAGIINILDVGTLMSVLSAQRSGR